MDTSSRDLGPGDRRDEAEGVAAEPPTSSPRDAEEHPPLTWTAPWGEPASPQGADPDPQPRHVDVEPEPDVRYERDPDAPREARIIALANQKGGVGKTTTVINLGASLAELGYAVLLIDMDPQGSLGVGLGAEPHALDKTMYNLLLDDGTRVDEVLRGTPHAGLDLLAANIDLAGAELSLVQEVAREQSLRRILDRLRHRYDFILIDCPPSLGLLTINALTAADSVVVPFECEYFALRGMDLLMNTIDMVKSRLNPRLHLLGLVATMVDTRTLHAREVLERVHEAFGDAVFKSTVGRTIRFAEAPVAGEPILTYAPESAGTDAYRDLAREVIVREAQR